MNLKNNVFIVAFAILGIMSGLEAVTKPKQIQSRTDPRGVVMKVSRPTMASAVGLAKPTVPTIGKTYTVRQLLGLINSNNPNKTSNFIVGMNGDSVVMDSDCWATKSAGIITNLTASKSVDMAGLKSLIQSNLDSNVVLRSDNQLISYLANDGRLDSTTQNQYGKILLYFVLNGYRFYLNDPHPGKITRVAGVMRSPALNIINKWDFNKSF